MNERIKEIRKALSYTQEQFVQHLGITRTAICNIERGDRGVSEQLIQNILKTSWNGQYVNENWLRTGEGDMFAKLPEENKFALSIKLIERFPNVKRLFEECADHPEEYYAALTALNKLMDSLNNKGSD